MTPWGSRPDRIGKIGQLFCTLVHTRLHARHCPHSAEAVRLGGLALGVTGTRAAQHTAAGLRCLGQAGRGSVTSAVSTQPWRWRAPGRADHDKERPGQTAAVLLSIPSPGGEPWHSPQTAKEPMPLDHHLGHSLAVRKCVTRRRQLLRRCLLWEQSPCSSPVATGDRTAARAPVAQHSKAAHYLFICSYSGRWVPSAGKPCARFWTRRQEAAQCPLWEATR